MKLKKRNLAGKRMFGAFPVLDVVTTCLGFSCGKTYICRYDPFTKTRAWYKYADLTGEEITNKDVIAFLEANVDPKTFEGWDLLKETEAQYWERQSKEQSQ